MFDYSSKNKDGYESTCVECKIKKREYYKNNKNAILEKCAEYRDAHKEEKATRDKKYAQENKEKIQQYQKEYREEHKLSNAEYQKQYRINNKDKLDEYKKAPHTRYKNYERNAKSKNRNFDLSEDEFVAITKLPCVYCGEYSDTYNGEPFSGVDRIDSNLGYSADNCVPCYTICNKMKLDMDVDAWFSQMNKIVNYCNLTLLTIQN